MLYVYIPCTIFKLSFYSFTLSRCSLPLTLSRAPEVERSTPQFTYMPHTLIKRQSYSSLLAVQALLAMECRLSQNYFIDIQQRHRCLAQGSMFSRDISVQHKHIAWVSMFRIASTAQRCSAQESMQDRAQGSMFSTGIEVQRSVGRRDRCLEYRCLAQVQPRDRCLARRSIACLWLVFNVELEIDARPHP